MTRRLAAFLLGLGSIVACPLVAAEGAKQSIEVTSTERFNFLPGGTIRLENSYGFVTVEGWDEPEVEVTVTKSTDRFYEAGKKEQAGRLFDQVRVATERRSDKELVISTTLPVRNGPFTAVLPSGSMVLDTPMPSFNKLGISVEFTVHVPRDSQLIVHQDHGYVFVSDLTGDIDVDSHTGDITVMLPDPGAYSIDARTRVGSVTSDFAGKALNQFLLGTRFTFAGQSPAKRIHLRMGRGSITIKNGPPSGPFWKN